jgi:MFS family permease
MKDQTPARAGPNPTWRALAVVVTAACLIALITNGMRTTFGLFTEPLSVGRGWSREVFALAIAMQNLVWGIGQPFAGALADRLGSARVLAAGTVLYVLGIIFMSFSTSPLALNLTAGVLIGLGLCGASFNIVLAVLGRRVPEQRRSWAFGVVMAAGSLGQFLFAPLGQAFIAGYGWANALLALSATVSLVLFLTLPLRGHAPAANASSMAELPVRAALGLALRHRSYWLLITGFFVCGFHVGFVTTHLPAHLTDIGVGAGLAALALGLIGLFNVAGSYSAGVLGGRHAKRYLLSSIYAARAVAISAFVLLPPSPAVVIGFAAAMGLLWLSTVPLTTGLVAVMFGTRFLATLYGIVFFSHQVGAFLGVWLGGLVQARTGTYDAVWWLCVALGIFAAIVHLPIRERPAPRFAVVTA